MKLARTHRPTGPLPKLIAGALLGLALSGPLHAQGKSTASARTDIRFAKELAARFQYIDLAESVIESLEKESVSSELGEELDLARCDVYAEGARREADPEQRTALYEKAIDAYRTYIDGNPHSEYLATAERSYVDLANSYTYALELQLDDAIGAEAEELRERITTTLEAALKRTSALIEELEGAESQTEKNQRWRLMLNRGQMLLTSAKASTEGTFLFGQAEVLLEELAFEAGETTGWGLNAYLLLGKVKAAQNQYEDATVFSQFVVETAIPPTEEGLRNIDWDNLPADVKQRRWKLVELAAVDLIDAYLNAGYPEDACRWALHYYNSWKKNGFSLSARGYLSLLAVARALLDSGGFVGGSINQGSLQWFATEEEMTKARFTGRRNTRSATDLALSIAETVNAENRGNTLQVRAQKVIAEVIDRPGIVVAPEVLFEAAQGEYYARNNHDALVAFKRVLSSLESQDEATRREFAAKVFWHIGSSLARMDRDLEAAMAFREGLDERYRGDPEFDPKNARSFYDAIKAARRDAVDDPLFVKLFRESENAVVNISTGDQSEIQKRQGDRAYDAGDYSTARNIYLGVTEGKVFEECKVKAILCLYKLKDFEAAKKEFRDYLEKYVVDPANALVDPTQLAARKKASAQATFYLGRMAFSAQKWDEVVQWLGDLHKKFPQQTDYGPVALYMAVRAHLAKGDVQAARDLQAEMSEAFPSHARTGASAYDIYNALSQEQKKAEESKQEERSLALKAEMAPYLHQANQTDEKKSYPKLRAEALLWMDLAKWAEAEAVLAVIIASFEGDPERADAIRVHIKPDYAHVLLRQKRVADAFAVLDPLVPDPRDKDDDRKVAPDVARDWCRSVCGWVEGDADQIIEVPGIGGDDNFEKANKQWQRLVGQEAIDNKWECPWYLAKFESIYAYHAWSKTDSSKEEQVQRLLEELRQVADDPDFSLVSENCGDDVLRNRYRWLWNLVK